MLWQLLRAGLSEGAEAGQEAEARLADQFVGLCHFHDSQGSFRLGTGDVGSSGSSSSPGPSFGYVPSVEGSTWDSATSASCRDAPQPPPAHDAHVTLTTIFCSVIVQSFISGNNRSFVHTSLLASYSSIHTYIHYMDWMVS